MPPIVHDTIIGASLCLYLQDRHPVQTAFPAIQQLQSGIDLYPVVHTSHDRQDRGYNARSRQCRKNTVREKTALFTDCSQKLFADKINCRSGAILNKLRRDLLPF